MNWSFDDFLREVHRQLIELSALRKKVLATPGALESIDRIEASQHHLLRKIERLCRRGDAHPDGGRGRGSDELRSRRDSSRRHPSHRNPAGRRDVSPPWEEIDPDPETELQLPARPDELRRTNPEGPTESLRPTESSPSSPPTESISVEFDAVDSEGAKLDPAISFELDASSDEAGALFACLESLLRRGHQDAQSRGSQPDAPSHGSPDARGQPDAPPRGKADAPARGGDDVVEARDRRDEFDRDEFDRDERFRRGAGGGADSDRARDRHPPSGPGRAGQASSEGADEASREGPARLPEPPLDPVLDESLLEESLLDESLLEESLLDESLLEESLLDESLLDESLLDDPALDESLLDAEELPGDALRDESMWSLDDDEEEEDDDAYSEYSADDHDVDSMLEHEAGDACPTCGCTAEDCGHEDDLGRASLKDASPEGASRRDGATEDGATEDGATEDGATEDGATEDGDEDVLAARCFLCDRLLISSAMAGDRIAREGEAWFHAECLESVQRPAGSPAPRRVYLWQPQTRN